jgi:hypothetical protein
MISDAKYELRDLPIDQKAAWVAHQLKFCGFPTRPCGASWGILEETK